MCASTSTIHSRVEEMRPDLIISYGLCLIVLHSAMIISDFVFYMYAFNLFGIGSSTTHNSGAGGAQAPINGSAQIHQSTNLSNNNISQ